MTPNQKELGLERDPFLGLQGWEAKRSCQLWQGNICSLELRSMGAVTGAVTKVQSTSHAGEAQGGAEASSWAQLGWFGRAHQGSQL